MRYAFIGLLVLAGCGESIHAPDDPLEGHYGDEQGIELDPAMLNNPTSELGTDRTRPIAKTLEWPGIGTEEGASYSNDAVVVDRILRDDADNNYAVRVRLKNTTKDVLKVNWLIRFYNRQGAQISAYVGGLGASEKWQGAVIEPFGYVTVSDFARVMGAEGFRLLIKGSGTNGDGNPDDPELKEERKAKRAAR